MYSRIVSRSPPATPTSSRTATTALSKLLQSLVVVGEWDGVQPPSRAEIVFSKLVNAPERRLVQIGEATHFVLLEKNRLQLYREVQMFLDE
jgi:pimeloyl-ACP methyl ester carboxylesterase